MSRLETIALQSHSEINFCSGWAGAAHSSVVHCFRAALGGKCIATHPLDLFICCQFSRVLISARGGRAPSIPAQLNAFAPHLERIALQRHSVYAISSLLSEFLLGADGRRAFNRNSMLSRRTWGELLCKASPRSLDMLSIHSCLNFRLGGRVPNTPVQLNAFALLLGGSAAQSLH